MITSKRKEIPVNFRKSLNITPVELTRVHSFSTFLKLTILLMAEILHQPESMPRPRPCFAEPGHHQHHKKRV